MELSDLYSQAILDIAGNPPSAPRLVSPDASARKVSRICGSRIEVDISVRDGIVVAYGHEVSACALGQTSAAIVAREIVGSSVAEVLETRQSMHDMLKASGDPPAGKWSDLKYLEPVRDYPQRHVSTLLVFDALASALEKLESKPELAART
ncbi:iron-sulfur cluster assembly scaffold protein [Devosia pacifica]|uniref:Iron-sulfur cluster assembly scaffold protein n=1 Tax=Devosia pacifica TaxID=1335967 RepID=A0A918RVC6_9HYPH|nr:iron-sulfur cluster assembly scaffold protein [Devosia pacifica]GHA13964.1 iron-sulfur cluster assembly scaffold protein [Devosia pacifica]